MPYSHRFTSQQWAAAGPQERSGTCWQPAGITGPTRCTGRGPVPKPSLTPEPGRDSAPRRPLSYSALLPKDRAHCSQEGGDERAVLVDRFHLPASCFEGTCGLKSDAVPPQVSLTPRPSRRRPGRENVHRELHSFQLPSPLPPHLPRNPGGESICRIPRLWLCH